MFKAPACSEAFVQGAFVQALGDLVAAKIASATSAVRTKAADPRHRGSVATEAIADGSRTPVRKLRDNLPKNPDFGNECQSEQDGSKIGKPGPINDGVG